MYVLVCVILRNCSGIIVPSSWTTGTTGHCSIYRCIITTK